MAGLGDAQKDAFWRDGYLTIENAVSPDLLGRLRDTFSGWVEESRGHAAPYGETINASRASM